MRVWKKWGFEDIIENNENYCLKVITCVDENWSSGGKHHYHPIKDETFYVIEGTLELDSELDPGPFCMSRLLRVGESYRIKPGVKHRFRSVGKIGVKCVFIEASTHHSDDDTVRVRHVVEDKVGRWVEE